MGHNIKMDLKCGLNSSGLGWGRVAGCSEHGNEPWGSVSCWELRYLPRNNLLASQGLGSV
jgi:hypothetical protein